MNKKKKVSRLFEEVGLIVLLRTSTIYMLLTFPFSSALIFFLEQLLITTAYFYRKSDFEGWLTRISVFVLSITFPGREKAKAFKPN